MVVLSLFAVLGIILVLFPKRNRWRELEEKVARRFSRDGWTAKLTPPTKDGGFDVDLRRGTERAIAECKQRSKGAVGVAVVRQVYGVMKSERAQHAFLITTTSFTRGAREFAKGKSSLTLVDGARLDAWLASSSRLENVHVPAVRSRKQ